MINRAREFAIAHHGEQKYGALPYSHHLDAGAMLARPFGEHAEVVAYLHDVVEDTAVTVSDLRVEFGSLIADAVALITDEPGSNRKERKEKTYAKMAVAEKIMDTALVVKVCDRLANVRFCKAQNNERLFTMYKSEHASFRRAVHRPGICDSLWAELNALCDS